jgi:hypothetical protein
MKLRQRMKRLALALRFPNLYDLFVCLQDVGCLSLNSAFKTIQLSLSNNKNGLIFCMIHACFFQPRTVCLAAVALLCFRLHPRMFEKLQK